MGIIMPISRVTVGTQGENATKYPTQHLAPVSAQQMGTMALFVIIIMDLSLFFLPLCWEFQSILPLISKGGQVAKDSLGEVRF